MSRTSLWRDDSNNRIEKPASFVDDIGQPLVMSVREISLEWRRLDGIDRQNRKQYRMPAKRFLVRADHTAAHFLNRFYGFRSCRRCLIEPAFSGCQAFRAGFGFARTPPGWCALDH